MRTHCNFQASFIPTFSTKQSLLLRAHCSKFQHSSHQITSFLSSSYALQSHTSQHNVFAHTIPRRVTGNNPTQISATLRSAQKSPIEGSVVHITCSIIHAAYEEVLVELKFPSRHDAKFMKCYELVGAILYAKRSHISIKQLEHELSYFSHSEGQSSLPLMSELQLHTVRAFLDKVYSVDDLLETRSHIGIAKYSHTVNARRVEYNRLRRFLRQGRLVSDVLKEICQCDIGTLRDIVWEKPPEVASRNSLPSRWANVLAVLTAYLREHIRFH